MGARELPNLVLNFTREQQFFQEAQFPAKQANLHHCSGKLLTVGLYNSSNAKQTQLRVALGEGLKVWPMFSDVTDVYPEDGLYFSACIMR